MERSEKSRERYTDEAGVSDARRDLLGAALRVDGFGTEFRKTDGRSFSSAVHEVRDAIDEATNKVQLERLCGQLKVAIDTRDKAAFATACVGMYDIVGIKWNESWRQNWENCLSKFFDEVVSGSRTGVSRFTFYRHGSLVIDFSGKAVSVYIGHGESVL